MTFFGENASVSCFVVPARAWVLLRVTKKYCTNAFRKQVYSENVGAQGYSRSACSYQSVIDKEIPANNCS